MELKDGTEGLLAGNHIDNCDANHMHDRLQVQQARFDLVLTPPDRVHDDEHSSGTPRKLLLLWGEIL